jgi:hypothetical protein
LTLILDSGGVSALAGQHARLAEQPRTGSGRAALAVGQPDPIVLTSDQDDLAALFADHSTAVTIARA